ncbi:MAG TPA: tyrosine-type recombinase/integrase [Gemmatimonadaceae bacterium]|nr:tyrosine-type recombinase/integrase [Gemmatimonadaceae bacterium]
MGRPRKRWTVTVGGYGHTVTAFERALDGPLYLKWWDGTRPNGKKTQMGNWAWRALRHHDRRRAEEQAKELSATLLATLEAAHTGRLTLAELFARYEREVTAHKKGDQPAEDRRRMVMWQHFLGSARDVRSIDAPTLDRFVRERRAGTIEVWELDDAGERKRKRLSTKPSDTTIGADIVFLNSVLNYATRLKLSDGSRLLAENPIRGYPRPKNKNVKRPVATYDRYLVVRAQCDAADPQGLFGPFMDLVEAMGWRVTAICSLRASDVDRTTTTEAPHGQLRKRGEVDKEGVEMWVPLSEAARAALDLVQERHPVIGETPLFAMPGKRPVTAWDRYHARLLLERAERMAELTPMDGGDFHPYRRAWATARKHLPAQDVAAAGGWRDLRSLERCYQQVDPQTLLTVVSEPTKVREVANGQ